MKNNIRILTTIILSFVLIAIACQNSKKNTKKIVVKTISNYKKLEPTPFDSTLVAPFFSQHPEFQKFQKEVTTLYQKQHYNYIWLTKRHQRSSLFNL